jgi:transcriptional regulator with XRE-family HTH domain
MPRRKTPEPLALRLGERIKALRTEKAVTLTQLAERSGISKGSLSSIERGLAMITLSTASKIARGLGIQLMFLVTFPEDGPIEALVDALREVSAEELVERGWLFSPKAPAEMPGGVQEEGIAGILASIAQD